jgi:hypothetical protein
MANLTTKYTRGAQMAQRWIKLVNMEIVDDEAKRIDPLLEVYYRSGNCSRRSRHTIKVVMQR